MKTVIQRVSEAAVEIGKVKVTSINKGLLILLGIEDSDTSEDINWLCKKIINLRIFSDQDGVMNTSIKDTNGAILSKSIYIECKYKKRKSSKLY